jgi:hypothetical protein
LYLILLTTLILLSIYWTVKKNTAGPVIWVIVGVFLISFGLTVFLQLGRIDGLLIDSIRGVITVVLSLLIHKELKD